MDKIKSTIQNLIPFPYFDEKGIAHDGINYSIPLKCKSCDKQCGRKIDLNSSEIFTCTKGYNYFNVRINSMIFIGFGISIKGANRKVPRKLKKTQNEIQVEHSFIQGWITQTSTLLKEIESYKDEKVKENFEILHDIIPTISLIFRTVETLIYQSEGNTFEKKVENSDSNLRTLYHSIDLLENRLKIMPIISNPHSAKYGQVTKCSPYKVFDKVSRLFSSTASRKGIKILLHSNTYITIEPTVYDSFMTIPFLLVENAIKYSVKNQPVDINLSQKEESVEISVSSYGPTVSEENTEKIFEKGFKDSNAKKFSSKGSGIGLYLASIVAEAHNTEIKYKNEGKGLIENGVQMGANVFYFTLRK